MTTLEYVQRVEAFRDDLYHDGDSFYLVTRIPFHLTATINARLAGFDCPELRKGTAYEREQGKIARDVSARWISTVLTTARVFVRTEPIEDDFGRWLGDLWAEWENGTTARLGDVLRDGELASIWPRKWRDEFDPAVTGKATP